MYSSKKFPRFVSTKVKTMKSLIVLACAFVAANAVSITNILLQQTSVVLFIYLQISKGVIEQFVNQVKDIGGKCIGETNAKPGIIEK